MIQKEDYFVEKLIKNCVIMWNI